MIRIWVKRTRNVEVIAGSKQFGAVLKLFLTLSLH